ncbi:Hypothetical_protein [Hexamita inflata]|uniref:Hypothetical_protein n=1 Tax=Hexamita inflata TaxID=28002 RepID=A0ABP1IKJ8_9EUKA
MNPYRHLLLQLYKLTGDSFKTERRQEVQQFHNELITVIQQMQNSNKYDQSVVNKKMNKLIEISQDYKQFYNSSLLEFVESMEIYGLEQYPQQIKSQSAWQELTPIKQEVTMQVRPTQRSRASALKRSRDDSVSLQPVSQTVYQMNNSQTLKLSLQENELKPATKVTPVHASISPVQAPVLRSSSLPKPEHVLNNQIKKPQMQSLQQDDNVYAQQIQQQNVQINQLTIQLNQTSQQVEYLTKQLLIVQNELECVKELIQTNQQPLQIKTVPVVQLWEVELLFLVYYVSNYILKYFATSNADDKFQQIISSWRLFMNYSLTQEGQKYDFDRIRPQSTIQSRYLIFQKGKIEITTCNKRTAMTKINAVEDVQGRSTNSLNKLRQF